MFLSGNPYIWSNIGTIQNYLTLKAQGWHNYPPLTRNNNLSRTEHPIDLRQVDFVGCGPVEKTNTDCVKVLHSCLV